MSTPTASPWRQGCSTSPPTAPPTGGDNHFTRDTTGGLVGRRVHTRRQYYLTDGLGSTVALVNPHGSVDHTYTYTPHGDTTRSWRPADSNPWRYTGAYQDNTTGMYHIGHRYLDPTLGRWTQPDPLNQVINGLHPSDANPYTYAACNPVNYTDSTGLQSTWLEWALATWGWQAASSLLCFAVGAMTAAVGLVICELLLFPVGLVIIDTP